MSHPYEEFERTKLWSVIDRAIAELEENTDLELTTARTLVVGFLTKAVTESFRRSGQLDAKLLAEIDEARAAGAIVILKWDGERDRNVHTVLISQPDAEGTFRRDGDDLATAVRECLAEYRAARTVA